MPVHRRVVETEQERQWKQLQALRQQQQLQQQPMGAGVVGGAPMGAEPGPTFATPIQVSRVRPPGGDMTTGASGPGASGFLGPRGPMQHILQQSNFNNSANSG